MHHLVSALGHLHNAGANPFSTRALAQQVPWVGWQIAITHPEGQAALTGYQAPSFWTLQMFSLRPTFTTLPILHPLFSATPQLWWTFLIWEA